MNFPQMPAFQTLWESTWPVFPPRHFLKSFFGRCPLQYAGVGGTRTTGHFIMATDKGEPPDRSQGLLQRHRTLGHRLKELIDLS